MILASGAVGAEGGGAKKPPALAVEDAHRVLSPGAVRVGGHVGQRLDACIRERVAAQNLEDLIEPFRKREETWSWRCEFWGKWFTSAAWAWRYNQDPGLRTKLDAAVAGLVATQTPDGYIGTYQEPARLESWDVWGRKYVLLGLLQYHALTGDTAALDAARRSADFLMRDVGPGKRNVVKLGRWNGLAASSILEPMVLLHRATGDSRYLEFAKWILKMWGEFDGPLLVEKARYGVPVFEMFSKPLPVKEGYGGHGQSKAYEMMSCYEGLAELYRTLGDKAWIGALTNLVRDIRTTEITVLGSGSNFERWCDGAGHQDENLDAWMETCVTATWIKLCAQVHRLTGDPLLVDDIERTACNALLAALKQQPDWWCHYLPMAGVRGPAPEQCQMHQNCCVASGPRGLALLPQIAVMKDKDGPVVNMYWPGTAEVPLSSGSQVAIGIETDYPIGDTVRMSVGPGKPESFTLSLRIPSWSRNTRLEVNGEPQEARPGTYARLRREWKPGDRVALTLDMRTRAVPLPRKGTHVALVRGPIVLALDRRISAAPAELAAAPLKVACDAEGFVAARPIKPSDPGIWMAFAVPFAGPGGAAGTINLCDCSSAGQTWSVDSQYRVWLPSDLDGRDLFVNVPASVPKH